MKLLSNLFIPLIILSVIIYSYKKIDVYDAFVRGCKESFPMILNMFGPVLSMILAINIFVSSGVIDYVFSFIKPFLIIINIPQEILPIIVLRPLSGSFGLALLNNMYKLYGPDSLISILTSIIQGSTDTTIYILTLYFGSIGIKKIRYAMWVGLLADLFAVIISIIIVPLFF